MNQEISMKIQFGDKIKMLAKNNYTNIDEIITAAKTSYSKKLKEKEITLKYADEDGDWLYLSEDDDLLALNEFASGLENKKVKLVVEIKKSSDVDMQVEEAKNALACVSLEDKIFEEKVKFEDLEDFKFTDITFQLEELFNSKEKFVPKKIFEVIEEATEGTKAEYHVKRFLKNRKGGRFHKEKFEKMFKKFFEKRSHCSSSPEGDYAPEFHGPIAGYGHFGHYGHSHHPHSQKKLTKFFKKFMNSYKDSSSEDISPEERRENRKFKNEQKQKTKRQSSKKDKIQKKKLNFKVKESTIIGKAGETVNFTVGIQDIAPHPIWLTGVKKVEGNENLLFEEKSFEEAKVFREQEHEIEISVTLPTEIGEYPATF